MESKNYILTKSDVTQIKELFEAILIINECIELIQTGKYYMLRPVYGQLRAILTDSTKKGKEPFFIIAKKLHINPELYFMEDLSMPNAPNPPVFSFSGVPISETRELPGQTKIKLQDFLNVVIVRHQGLKLKVFETINALSNKFGGSHYDNNIPSHIAEVQSLLIGGLPTLDRFIFELSRVLKNISIDMFNSISEYEMIFRIFVKDKVENDNIIFDFKLGDSGVRLTALSNNAVLTVVMSDFRNQQIIAKTKLTENSLNTITIIHKINPDLSSELGLKANDGEWKGEVSPIALLWLNQIGDYSCFYNRGHEFESQDFEFGLGEIMINRKVSSTEVMEVKWNFLKNREKDMVYWFEKGSFAHSKPGNQDLNFEGRVVRKEV
jgi:hypothetical protein